MISKNIIVIGAGVSGIMAGERVAELHANALVLEKMGETNLIRVIALDTFHK